MVLKFHQLPIGAKFRLLDGLIYTKISKSYAQRDGTLIEAHFAPNCQILDPIKESISEAILKALA